MRRDSVTLEVANVSWLADDGDPRRPSLILDVDDDESDFRRRLIGDDRPPESSDLDFAFRFQGAPDGGDGSGVLSITNRVTGEFLLEVNAEAPVLVDFVTAVRRYAERTDDATRYTARVVQGDEPLVEVEKRTLLVYASDGELLRQHSLIPSGVEI